jgi:methylmalonyl-CoA mutase
MTRVIEQEPDELPLAAEFPAATRQQWQRLVARVLGHADGPVDAPERELATVTADGIEIAPLYTADDGRPDPGYPGQAPFVRGRTPGGHRAGWDIRQRHDHPDPAAAREQVMEDLEGGVSSLWLGLGDGQIPVGALPDVLAEVYLDLASIVLDAGGQFAAAAAAFLGTAAGRGVPGTALSGCLGADPLGVMARTGADADLEAAAVLAGRCSAELPGMRAIVVDALPFHEAGGTDAQELGCALAAGTEYLRALRAAGLSGPAAAGQLEFRYAATADQFATIAKLRAARRAWTRVVEQCGIAASTGGQRQHAVTSWPMLTRRDPWNNILRGTLACFAASTGGADAITVTPFDAAIGQPDRLARRVARNIHAVLGEESHVARVIDPAGGSWYVEDLTRQLAARAWACFQDIERAGGLRAALASGLVAGQLAASQRARRDALSRHRDVVTGVTVFPLAGETLLDRPPRRQGEPAGGLPRIRWAQWHEELRDRADAYAMTTGSPPTVSLAPADAAQAGRVAAVLAPVGIAVATAGPVVTASEVLAGDLDVLDFADRLLATLEVA